MEKKDAEGKLVAPRISDADARPALRTRSATKKNGHASQPRAPTQPRSLASSLYHRILRRSQGLVDPGRQSAQER
ncbi:uncharacterized protein SCHCODRAFT_02629824 [Schizophyllum commune H4-8]|uniref:uncharacterized protein n=1 Tax=Schizophyllum commune (strain H4-8 / FGSC 9210) TaxID=578458 RepID=UPI00215F8384|nr:uncharacterized protein SCHCODRAFT_02629824 [Schizophyllum commune H4-8]KAI5891698.1 hypothetical protein SCHCODRAFT_02629824 [Schizophyllum commune H4-8]